MRFRVLPLILYLAVPSGAHAAASECPIWFPDLHCDRQARYDGFIAPMTFPYLFEDPFITTEVSAWGIWHQFPDSSALGGGDYRVAALQVRVAVTERFALIATKDGLIRSSPNEDVLGTEKGWADLGIGFKFALIDETERRVIVTPSLRYELTQGTRDVFQGNGDGTWIPAVSFGLGLGPAHLVGAFGAQLPVDGDEESTSIFYNAQVGWPVTERFVPFASFNGITWVDDGDGSTTIKTKVGDLPIDTALAALGKPPIEGVDVANLGTSGVDGHDYFTWAIGFRYALTPKTSLGVAYSRPVSKARREITKQRVSVNLIYGF